jgi:hypothetical protein
MPFVEKYVAALNASNLQDDEYHRATHALTAAALADLSGGSGTIVGSMLARAKFANGVVHKTFESGTRDLAQLARVWEAVVIERGRARGWMKIKSEWDVAAAHAMYRKIALHSLAHWLGGECDVCHGTKMHNHRVCAACGGSGRASIEGGRLEVECIKDMVSELEGLFQAHGGRAGAKMRRAA